MTPSAWAFVRTVIWASLSGRRAGCSGPAQGCVTGRAVDRVVAIAARGSPGGTRRALRRSSGGGGIHHQLGLHREGADPATGCVEDGVGDGCGDADLADLAHALGAERADQVVVHVDEV